MCAACKMKTATWTLTCGNCNRNKITVTVPFEILRDNVIKIMRCENPNWKILPTKCPGCQGNSGIKLKWKYLKPKHTFIYTANSIDITGTLSKVNKGRNLTLVIRKDGKSEILRIKCKSVAAGKEVALNQVINLMGEQL